MSWVEEASVVGCFCLIYPGTGYMNTDIPGSSNYTQNVHLLDPFG